MTHAIQTALPASALFSTFMAPSAMNTRIPVRVRLPESSRTSLITTMPSIQPNRTLRRAYMNAYGRDLVDDMLYHSQVRPTRFRLRDLMRIKFPEQIFVVEGLMPQGLLMLAGSMKIGKSWLLLDLALHVAKGEPFLGRKTKQGGVLYLALEDHGRRLVDRVAKITSETELDELPLEIWLTSPRTDQGGLDAIEQWLMSEENPQLIIVDVWGRFAPEEAGGSKNDYLQTTKALQPLQELANKYSVAICLVHHVRKSSSDGSTPADPFDQILGSRALTSNMDATLMLTRTRMMNDATLSITGRDIVEEHFNLTFDRTTCRWNEVGRTLAPSLSPELQATLDAIAAGHTKTSELLVNFGIAPTALQNRLKSLRDKGVIEHVCKGEYRLAGQPAPDPEAELPSDMNDPGDIAEPDFSGLI